MKIGLEIHHIYVEGGDATAIVIRDKDKEKEEAQKMDISPDGVIREPTGGILHKILIDAGCEGSAYRYLVGYCQEYLYGSTFDCIIASHYHEDHVKGFSSAGIDTENYIDIGGHNGIAGHSNLKNYLTVLKDYSGFIKFLREKKSNDAVKHHAIPFLDANYLENIKKNPANRKKKFAPLINIKINETNCEIVYNDDTAGKQNIKFHCVCASAVLPDGTDIIDKEKASRVNAISVDHNDLSLAFLIEFGDFRYFTAGDLSGNITGKGNYYNIEEPVVNYLEKEYELKKKPITAMKANHHGSEHSNYYYAKSNNEPSDNHFLGRLKPEIIVVPCNFKHRIPHQNFFDRVARYIGDKTILMCFSNQINLDDKLTDHFQKLSNLMAARPGKTPMIKTNLEKKDKIFTNNNPVSVIVCHPKENYSDDSFTSNPANKKEEHNNNLVYIINNPLKDLPIVAKSFHSPLNFDIAWIEYEKKSFLHYGFALQTFLIAQSALFYIRGESNDNPEEEFENYFPSLLTVYKEVVIPENKGPEQQEKANELQQKLFRKIDELFNKYYRKDESEKLYVATNKGNEDEIKTLNNLLFDNSTQPNIQFTNTDKTKLAGYFTDDMSEAQQDTVENELKKQILNKNQGTTPLRRSKRGIKRKADEAELADPDSDAILEKVKKARFKEPEKPDPPAPTPTPTPGP